MAGPCARRGRLTALFGGAGAGQLAEATGAMQASLEGLLAVSATHDAKMLSLDNEKLASQFDCEALR